MSVRNALIATEDVAFYRHWGVDLRRLVIAMGENVVRGRSRWHGASTITQQLAKNLFLTQERTITRKMKEFVTAVELEKTYTKDEILALYLNTVYYGSGAYGIEAAAITYFGKKASELTLPESATLIATLKNPTAYNPEKNPLGSLGRRNLVLSLMEKEKFITPAVAAKAKKEPSRHQIYSRQPPRRGTLFHRVYPPDSQARSTAWRCKSPPRRPYNTDHARQPYAEICRRGCGRASCRPAGNLRPLLEMDRTAEKPDDQGERTVP